MGLLDKVKAQATAATEMAKDAAAKGQAKMNDVQAKKTADGMLRDLGAASTQQKRANPPRPPTPRLSNWSHRCRRTSPSTARSRWPPNPRRPPRRPPRRRRLGGACAAAAPEGGRPGFPSATSADRSDAVAERRPTPGDAGP